jgi:branched-chain amino acid transport system permease protein|uniref:Branched-chain amino acid ABC transporter permease n=1 Tax=Acidicaldus sp. TaxID=1872105 RepID=A0A8J4M5J1_9PROT
MDLDALRDCLASAACVVTQTTSGLIVGLLLFLVAAGLTLIFGVLKIVNFAHGTFYMLGAYVAFSVLQASGSYLLAVLAAGLSMAAFGVLFERFLIARVYGSNVLMQLLVCYAVVLIFDDLVKMIWGADFHAMGMPEAFQAAPIFIAGGVVPPFYAGLIVISLLIAALLGLGLGLTRIGKITTAAAQNPSMVSALGINTTALFALVFAVGGGLAGLAGGLAAPVRSLTPGMGFSVLIESFIVTVIGGMGSIAGALIAAIVLGLLRGFGTIGFPLFTDGLMYVAMIIILVVRPNGIFGRELV